MQKKKPLYYLFAAKVDGEKGRSTIVLPCIKVKENG